MLHLVRGLTSVVENSRPDSMQAGIPLPHLISILIILAFGLSSLCGRRYHKRGVLPLSNSTRLNHPHYRQASTETCFLLHPWCLYSSMTMSSDCRDMFGTSTNPPLSNRCAPLSTMTCMHGTGLVPQALPWHLSPAALHAHSLSGCFL